MIEFEVGYADCASQGYYLTVLRSWCGNGKNTWSPPQNRNRSINKSLAPYPWLHHTNGHRTKPQSTKPYYTKPSCRMSSSNSGDPVPSSCYRKGKRREDIDLTKGLWNNGEPHYLPGRRGGTSSKLLFYNSSLTADRLHLTRQWMLVVTAFFSPVASKYEASEASTASTTRLCFPITRDIFFTILRE